MSLHQIRRHGKAMIRVRRGLEPAARLRGQPFLPHQPRHAMFATSLSLGPQLVMNSQTAVRAIALRVDGADGDG
jgi:hypothetical protein